MFEANLTKKYLNVPANNFILQKGNMINVRTIIPNEKPSLKIFFSNSFYISIEIGFSIIFVTILRVIFCIVLVKSFLV